jgi:hypothetical protein
MKIPKDIDAMLLDGENVIIAVKQSRWKALFTPDTIVATSQRIIRHSPSGFLGLRKDIEDYRYEDIANFKISRGLTVSRLTLGHRFMSEDLVLDKLPNRAVVALSKAVSECIGRSRTGAMPPPPPAPPPDAREGLRLRFARGEITAEQFAEMKRTLSAPGAPE